MKALQEALEKLRQTRSIGLEDFRKLKMKDVEHLTEGNQTMVSLWQW
jgi:hypothetical protein